ncbi:MULTISPECIES: hypothetical protein [Chromobacterium]|uniref:Uncharacterized protein n=1 Tax=Chromobacterium haemolyticum TaxID=394935 RepID=A0ABS3GII3_9NEIS|nr:MULTISPECIES: hypothetical protein [Chromobacterium]MBK0413323.1 hypothetical protein [Chromobacterium haemolyticum]MBO0414425.1 hypothetical protein [Chromobacterium haemolyticum]MBO0497716.1 hypothetical protein [Chromobacterium haemolyticum]MDH0340020.1 hypothetical protein [Chromobacterium haemolyticum]QOD84545.1 hypothetical protein IEZ30_08785 [Chromobacterium haemolyticum]
MGHTQAQYDSIKMKFMDWRRLPRAFRAVIQGQPQVLVSRPGRDFYVPVQFV